MEGGVELRAQEEVIGLVRRGLLVEVPRFVFAALWIFLPFFFFFPLLALGWFGLLVAGLLFISGAYYAKKRYRMWRHTMLLITSDRVIDIDQLGMRRRHVAELPYRQIDAVHVQKVGLLGRLFSLGRVQVETTSAHAFDLEIMGVHRPEDVRQLILDVQYLQKNKTVHEPTSSTKKIS